MDYKKVSIVISWFLEICFMIYKKQEMTKETYLTVVEFLMLEIHSTFFYKISPGLPFSMYIIMVRRKNALRNKITEKTEFVYFFF